VAGLTDSRDRRLLVLVAAVVALLVVVAIGVALVVVERDESADPAREAPSPAVSQLRIVSLPTLSYQAREFTTEPGLNEIEFVSQGTHTLVFSDPALQDFELESSGGRPERGTVKLAPGRDYEIRDAIPGHAQAGERALIHVTDGPPGP
jgi:hypothetical protein